MLASELEVLNAAETPPFHHDEHANEDLRLRYRYLDLRRDEMSERIMRHQDDPASCAAFWMRTGFHRHRDAGAHARDAGRRTRLHRAQPHPSGRVLRAAAVAAAVQAAADDVRLRSLLPDRHVASATRTCAPIASPSSPSSTSRLSFMDENAIMQLMEQLIRELFRKVLGEELPDPFPRMGYAEAVERFGIRPAGPAHPAGAGRGQRPDDRGGFQGVCAARPPIRTAVSRR